ncbi:DUF4105 domain-containing protein [Myxococcota bacterium]|nr:DUF4105 domain-containing protein [Myxococcota bacterium]
MKISLSPVFIFILVFTSSCATVFSGTDRKLVITSNVESDVLIDGKYIGKTPLSSKIKIKTGQRITVRKKGYEDKIFILQTAWQPLFYLNFINISGSTTDYYTDAIYQYSPAQIHVDLSPKSTTNTPECRSRLFSLILHTFEDWLTQVASGDGAMLRTAFRLFNDNGSEYTQWIAKLREILKNEDIPRSIACQWSNSLGKSRKVVQYRHPWFPDPTPERWAEKDRISLVFVGADPRSPASTFGHSYLVAHNERIPEPDAVIIEYVGITQNSTLLMAKGLFATIKGLYRLRSFQDKRIEYDLEDRSLWIYPLDINYKKKIDERLKKYIGKPPGYQFIFHNCSDGIFKLIHGRGKFGIVFPNELIPENSKKKRHFIPSGQAESIHYFNKLPRKLRKKYDKFKFAGMGASHHKTVSTAERNYLIKVLPYMARRTKDPDESRGYLTALVAVVKRSLESDIKKVQIHFSRKNPYQDMKRRTLTAGYYRGFDKTSDSRVNISWRLGEYGFGMSHPDFFENSSLEFFRLDVIANKEKAGISKFTLYKLDARENPAFLKSSFVRYIDLSYYGNKVLFPDSNVESTVTGNVGFGFSIPVFTKYINFSSIVAGGLFWSESAHIKNPESYLNIALSTALNFTFLEFPRGRILYTWSPFAPDYLWKHMIDMELLLFDYKYFSLSAHLRFYETENSLDFKDRSMLLNLNYRF